MDKLVICTFIGLQRWRLAGAEGDGVDRRFTVFLILYYLHVRAILGVSIVRRDR